MLETLSRFPVRGIVRWSDDSHSYVVECEPGDAPIGVVRECTLGLREWYVTVDTAGYVTVDSPLKESDDGSCVYSNFAAFKNHLDCDGYYIPYPDDGPDGS